MNKLAALAVFASSSLLAAQGDSFAGLAGEYQSALTGAADQDAVTLEYLPRFERAAKEHAGQEAAVPFLMWIVENGGPHRGETITALDSLVQDYQGSPSLVPLADRLPYLFPVIGPELVGEYLDRLVAYGDTEVRAHARYSRASMFSSKWGADVSQADRDAAEADLEEAMKLTKDAALDDLAKSLEFEARNLVIGDVAPDIFGVDIDGVPFKLSDYRGKVVVIDFWGDW